MSLGNKMLQGSGGSDPDFINYCPILSAGSQAYIDLPTGAATYVSRFVPLPKFAQSAMFYNESGTVKVKPVTPDWSAKTMALGTAYSIPAGTAAYLYINVSETGGSNHVVMGPLNNIIVIAAAATGVSKIQAVRIDSSTLVTVGTDTTISASGASLTSIARIDDTRVLILESGSAANGAHNVRIATLDVTTLTWTLGTVSSLTPNSGGSTTGLQMYGTLVEGTSYVFVVYGANNGTTSSYYYRLITIGSGNTISSTNSDNAITHGTDGLGFALRGLRSIGPGNIMLLSNSLVQLVDFTGTTINKRALTAVSTANNANFSPLFSTSRYDGKPCLLMVDSFSTTYSGVFNTSIAVLKRFTLSGTTIVVEENPFNLWEFSGKFVNGAAGNAMFPHSSDSPYLLINPANAFSAFVVSSDRDRFGYRSLTVPYTPMYVTSVGVGSGNIVFPFAGSACFLGVSSGGGGGGDNGTIGGNGGNSGGEFIKTRSVTVGQSFSYTVGAVGTGVSAGSNATGGNAAATTVDGCTAYGGKGGSPRGTAQQSTVATIGGTLNYNSEQGGIGSGGKLISAGLGGKVGVSVATKTGYTDIKYVSKYGGGGQGSTGFSTSYPGDAGVILAACMA